MATAALIGMELPDSSIRYIYCGYDGYLDGVGEVLKNHYTTSDKVEAMIALGDVVSLGEIIAADPNDPKKVPCEYYYRDKKEDWNDVAPRHANIISNMPCDNFGVEYVYIYSRYGVWRYIDASEFAKVKTVNDLDIV